MSELSEKEWDAPGQSCAIGRRGWNNRGVRNRCLSSMGRRLIRRVAPVYIMHICSCCRLRVWVTGIWWVKGMTRIPSMRQLRNCYPAGGYLMVSVAGITWAMSDKEVVSQFFRRRICALQGRPDGWDYLAYPNLVAMDETISLLTGWAMGSTSFSGRDVPGQAGQSGLLAHDQL